MFNIELKQWLFAGIKLQAKDPKEYIKLMTQVLSKQPEGSKPLSRTESEIYRKSAFATIGIFQHHRQERIIVSGWHFTWSCHYLQKTP